MKHSIKKKDQIEYSFIKQIKSLAMDIPSNYEDIVQFIYEDVCEAADPVQWNDIDVIIGFRRWIENKSE